jgi:Dolichyl-phosphate-mannose-protein mannosyltransferase
MQSTENRVESARVAGRAARFAKHRVSAAILAILLIIVGLATAWNLEGWPGRVDDDEGTYVAQAWAIVYEHTLTHYSYWYDHPPLGWIQIAAFAWITDGFNRVASAVYVGREFMWCLTLVGCVLVYVLCRRLHLRRATATVAVLLFGLSPIAQYFHRMVSLDNIETVWVLAALVAATSSRRGWGPALRTGVCAAIAVLSKETAIIVIPVIVWVLWQHLRAAAGQPMAIVADGGPADPGDLAVEPVAAVEPVGTVDPVGTVEPVGGGAGGVGATTGAAAAGAAAAGSGPVSAGVAEAAAPIWMPDFSAQWQTWSGQRAERAAQRRDSANVPRLRRAPGPADAARSTAPMSPRWQIGVFAVTVCALVALYPLYALQRGQFSLWWSTLTWQFLHRPGSGSLLDSGSTTYSMVHGWVSTDPWLLVGGFIAALLTLLSPRLRPFGCALLLQVVVLIHGGYLPFFYVTAIVPFAAVSIAGTADALWSAPLSRLGGLAAGFGARAQRYAPYLGRALVAVAALTFAAYVLPTWIGHLSQNSTARGNVPYLAAAAWAERNVPSSDVVVVDDYLWVDLKRQGLDPLWMWKINPQTTPDGWKSINYILIQPQSAGTLAGMPSLEGAYAHSVLVKNFGGGLTVRKVIGAG